MGEVMARTYALRALWFGVVGAGRSAGELADHRHWRGADGMDQALAVSRDRGSSSAKQVRLPPRWFIVSFWHGHRALLRATGGRFGLWRPKRGGWGTLRLTTTGRRTGKPRQVVVGYFDDGPNLVTMAMNGWGEAEPAWWLNLQAHPNALAETRDGRVRVRAHAAQGEERERLWSRWAEIDKNLDEYAARRPKETAVVVLEREDVPDSFGSAEV